jgi:Rrf2 family iron-sulfur cluster assembly transcriptional regulator
MRLTTKGRYALRSVIFLARRSSEGSPVSIRDIAAEESISADFLEQIFYRLRKKDIVASVRGPGGGFYFSRPLESVSLLDILEAADEGFDFSPCMGDEARSCGRESHCSARQVWEELDALIRDFARSKSLPSLIGSADRSIAAARSELAIPERFAADHSEST